MNLAEYIKLIGRKKGTIFSILFLFIIAAAIFIFTQTWKYEDRASLLMTQNFSAGVDPYQASRANDYLSGVLAKVVPSNSFYTQVLNAGFNINKNYFPAEAEKQLKAWQKTIYARHISGTSMIQISVFHQDRYQADQILRAAIQVLETKHNLYHGGGNKVNLRVVDEPIISSRPVRPNIGLDFGLAVAIGFIFALSYIYVLPDEKYDLRFWPKKKIKSLNIALPDEANIDESGGDDVVREALKKLKESKRVQNISIDYNRHNYASARRTVPQPANETEPQANSEMNNLNQENNYSENDDLAYQNIIKRGSMDNIIG